MAQIELGFNVDLFDTTWYDQKKNDVETYTAFAEAMLLTGEPQFVAIYRTNQKGNRTGHAMIAYKESRRTNSRGQEEGVLHIADPNFPGQAREIVINFDNGSFVPYYSGAKAPENGEAFNLRAYPEIYFKEKQDLLVAQTQGKLLWEALENETVGNQDFPKYTLYVCRKNSDYSVTRLGELHDGYKVTGYDSYCFDVDVDGTAGALWIYDEQAQGIIAYEKASVRLKEGDNLLGFHVVADATYTNADQETVTDKEWVGFKWINVIYREKEDATTSVATSTTTASEDEGDLDAEACCAVDGIDYRIEITTSPESKHWAILCEASICFTNTLTDWVGLYMHQKRGSQEAAWYGENFPPGELCRGFSRTLQPGVQQDAYYALETIEFTATYSGNPQDGYQIGQRCKWIGDDVSASGIRTVKVESMNPCD